MNIGGAIILAPYVTKIWKYCCFCSAIFGLSIWLFLAPGVGTASASDFKNISATGNNNSSLLSSLLGFGRKDARISIITPTRNLSFPAKEIDMFCPPPESRYLQDSHLAPSETSHADGSVLRLRISKPIGLFDQKASFVPMIWLKKQGAALVLQFTY
jgi:hypothetical protein